VSGAERVIGDSKYTRREHLLAIFIVRKGARLANQRVNNVSIVNRYQFLTHESRHRLDRMSLVSDRDLLGPHADIDSLTDQPAGH
jgi:hypothetical protein